MKSLKTGITIVELLIATVILSLLIALIFMLVRHFSASSASLTAQNSFQNICGRLTDQLKQDLGSAKEAVVGQHRIDLQRYTSWATGSGLSTEHIAYSASEVGLLIERNGSRTFHDLDNVRKVINGTVEFTAEVKEFSEAESSGMSIVDIEIRIVSQHQNQIPSFVHRASISTSARIQTASAPEKIKYSN